MKQKKTKQIFIEIETLRVTKTRSSKKKSATEQRFDQTPKEPENDSYVDRLFWRLIKQN